MVDFFCIYDPEDIDICMYMIFFYIDIKSYLKFCKHMDFGVFLKF